MKELIETIFQNTNVDSPLGLIILIWLAISLQKLNTKLAIIIDRVDRHESRIGIIEGQLRE